MIGTAHAAEGAASAPFWHDPTFWVAVAFVILIVSIAKPVWGFVTKALDAKIEAIGSQLDAATRLREEAQELLASYKRKIAEAEK